MTVTDTICHVGIILGSFILLLIGVYMLGRMFWAGAMKSFLEGLKSANDNNENKKGDR